MGHTPYGYKIESGKAVIDEKEADQIKDLFQAYLSGLSLTEAAQRAGIKRYHASIARMLTNRRYLGDDFYPQIISEDVYEQAETERLKRAQRLGRIWEPEVQSVMPRMSFIIPKVETLHEDPFKQAEYAYSLIESEVITDEQS